MRKERTKPCAFCGAECTEKELFYYVDGNNIAITKNAKGYCFACVAVGNSNKNPAVHRKNPYSKPDIA